MSGSSLFPGELLDPLCESDMSDTSVRGEPTAPLPERELVRLALELEARRREEKLVFCRQLLRLLPCLDSPLYWEAREREAWALELGSSKSPQLRSPCPCPSPVPEGVLRDVDPCV